jgi:hypothetical protein
MCQTRRGRIRPTVLLYIAKRQPGEALIAMLFRGDLDMGLLKRPPQHSKQRPTQAFVAADGSAT